MAGPGVPQRVDPIPLIPPRNGLLAAIEQLGNAVTSDPSMGADAERWLNGITYQAGLACGVNVANTSWPFGCAMNGNSETEDKTGRDGTSAGHSIATTYPFLGILFNECSTFGWEAANYVGRVQELFEAWESAIVEYETWTGKSIQHGTDDFGQNAPDPKSWLASDNATIVSSDALEPTVAVAALEDAMTACGGAGGMIHMAASSVEMLQARGLLVADRNILKTVLGTTVVPGQGYPGTSPAGADPAAGETWVYATGPMRYYRTPKIVILPGSYGEALVRFEDGGIANSLRFTAERAYLVDFDRCCHFAVNMALDDVAADH